MRMMNPNLTLTSNGQPIERPMTPQDPMMQQNGMPMQPPSQQGFINQVMSQPQSPMMPPNGMPIRDVGYGNGVPYGGQQPQGYPGFPRGTMPMGGPMQQPGFPSNPFGNSMQQPGFPSRPSEMMGGPMQQPGFPSQPQFGRMFSQFQGLGPRRPQQGQGMGGFNNPFRGFR